jgi:hypothetical protein
MSCVSSLVDFYIDGVDEMLKGTVEYWLQYVKYEFISTQRLIFFVRNLFWVFVKLKDVVLVRWNVWNVVFVWI